MAGRLIHLEAQMNTEIAITMHLIHDEIEKFTSRTGQNFTFRVRVWGGKLRRPIVLVQQTEFGQDTFWMTSKVANWVVDTILHRSRDDILYFESSHVHGQPLTIQSLSEIAFGRFGKLNERSRLIDPVSFPTPWTRLEELLGRPVTD